MYLPLFIIVIWLLWDLTGTADKILKLLQDLKSGQDGTDSFNEERQ